ncbi:hypothetical protein [Vibrio gallaecicus]|uniref:hypothetical protein n=1 Tax=Vibrio gallaecicus TaxID=552386 RepID=UPI0025B5A2B8|nr:hypothetical protein [Vibrio gallaecicus]MDN3613025.1 hypothetical protein [Vibrio gallaecicus]
MRSSGILAIHLTQKKAQTKTVWADTNIGVNKEKALNKKQIETSLTTCKTSKYSVFYSKYDPPISIQFHQKDYFFKLFNNTF